MARIKSRTTLGDLAQKIVLLSALMVLVVAGLGAALGAVGGWRPALVFPLILLGAVGCLVVSCRLPYAPLPTWPVASLLALCSGFCLWMAATASAQVLPRRDAGSNLQAALSLARTGRRIVGVSAASIGGPGILDIPGITLASPAFYEIGSAAAPAIQPQFVIGPAAIYSLGDWLGGPTTIWWQAPLMTALGLLAIGLIVAMTVGPWWGSAAVVAVGASFPLVHTARSTYSEPLATLTLGAGFLALVLAARAGRHDRGARTMAFLAGLLVGGTVLVRIDGLRETILLVPIAAVALVTGARWPWPALLGAALGAGLGMLTALLLSYRYLGDIAASLIPLVALGVLLSLAGAVLVFLAGRGQRLRPAIADRLPDVLATATIVGGVALACRPLVMTVRQSAADPGARVVAGLQQRQGLTVDGGRTYAEYTVIWLDWWIGPVALVVALVTLAGLAHVLAARWTTGGGLPEWAAPLVIATGSTLLTLWRPGITPDHPWAERRLLIALPLVAVLCIVAAGWVWGLHGHAGVRTWQAGPGLQGIAVLLAASAVIPAALATQPHATERVEGGSLAAVDAVCRALAPGDVVLAVDSRAANEWPQVIRGQCGHPALSTSGALRADSDALAAAIAQIRDGLPAGSRLILLAADSDVALAGRAGAESATGGDARTPVVDAVVQEDDRLLERRPEGLVPLPIRVWLGVAS